MTDIIWCIYMLYVNIYLLFIDITAGEMMNVKDIDKCNDKSVKERKPCHLFYSYLHISHSRSCCII